MPIDDIVNVVVRVSSSGVARSNFGIPLLAVQHALTSRPLVEAFGSLREAEAAGHVSPSPAHKALSVMFAPTNRPRVVKVGRRAPRVQTIRISAVETLPGNGVVYRGEIDGEAWSYTVSGSANLAAQMTAIASAINALNVAVTATASGTYVDVASASGATHKYKTTALSGVMKMIDQSGDTNVNTDLAAFAAFDPDFYGVSIDTTSEADITDAAAWLEATDRIGAYRTHDAGVPDGTSTTDIGADLQTANYARAHLAFTRIVGNLVDVAILANRLTADPGSDTWAYKGLVGVDVDTDLSTAEITALESKNVNYYTRVKGRNLTFWGKAPSGFYIDLTRGTDWFVARVQERFLGVFAANEKVDFDDSGIALFESALRAQAEEAVAVRFLAPDFEIEVPLSADIDPVDREERVLRNISFRANYLSAIHKIDPLNVTFSFGG